MGSFFPSKQDLLSRPTRPKLEGLIFTKVMTLVVDNPLAASTELNDNLKLFVFAVNHA